MCLQKFPPVCRFSKICHWTDLVTCACRNSPPSLQIFQNLPLDRYLPMCLQKFPPRGADFPKSATGQLPKLPTCACRNSPPVCRFSKICHWTVIVTYMCLQKFPPPSLQIFQNLPLDRYLHVLAEIPPPSLQIFQNLPLDSYLSYLHVLAEIPPVCRFSKICHWTVT